MIKSRWMRDVGHVSRMGKKMKRAQFLVGNFEGNKPRGRPSSRWEDSTNVDFKIKCGCVDDLSWFRMETAGRLL